MYCYSKKSKKHILHNQNCPYARHYNSRTWALCYTADEATSLGYAYCNHCSPIGRLYRKEKKAIKAICREFDIQCALINNKLFITSKRNRWRIIQTGKNCALVLLHQNRKHILEESNDKPPGFHTQNIHKSTLAGYLRYIAHHDEFFIGQASKIAEQPTKKLSKKERKAYDASVRRKAIRNVLNVIESIDK